MTTRYSLSEAIVAVRSLMKANSSKFGTQALLARASKLSQKSWSNYLSLVSKPSKLARKQIHRRLGVPVAAWDIPAAPSPTAATSTAAATGAQDAQFRESDGPMSQFEAAGIVVVREGFDQTPARGAA